MSAIHNNAGIVGTLAHGLTQLRTNLNIIDIVKDCTFPYNVSTGIYSPTILDIPALKTIVGAFNLVDIVGNQTVIATLPHVCARVGVCGVGISQESDVAISVRTDNNWLISSHTKNIPVSYPAYIFFVYYK